MIRLWTLIAIVSGGLFLGGAGASHAMVVSASPFEPELPFEVAPPPRSQPWWVGFNDETLNQLIGTARMHSASVRPSRPLDAIPLESGIAAAYVSIRVQALGQTYLENERSAIGRQLQLMIASQPQHDDFIKELSRRKSKAEDSIKKIKAQQDIHVAFLAAQCGMSKEALMDAIAEVLSDRSKPLPQFLSPVPRALPMALLVNRDDVNLAATLYGIDSATSLVGLIETMDESDGTTNAEKSEASEKTEEAEQALRGYPLYSAVVAQARDEVSAAMSLLHLQSEVAITAYQRMRSVTAEFEASKARRDRREISEVQLMEDFQVMLQGLHMLAVANGELAIAWIALITHLGNGTSLDGGSTSQSAKTRVLPKVSQKPSDP